jgi:hypothetical protein
MGKKADDVYTPEQRAAIQKMTAADTGLAPVSMPFREAVACAGTLETLLPVLRAGLVMAYYSCLYTWPGGGVIPRPTPNNIMPPWWAHAHDIDAAAGRARFTMDTYEVLAVGITLERDAVEALWPAAASEPKAKSKTEPKRTRRGKQMSRLWPVLRDLYPPDGMPPDHVKTVKVVQKVLHEYKAREMGDVSRDVIERAIGRRKS